MPDPVGLVLLRGILPDVPLTPGVVVHARVLDPRTLVLASAERVHLRVVEPAQPQAAEAAQIPPTAYQVALPGGAVARFYVEEPGEEEARRGGAGEVRSVVVRYDSPTLGRLDVRVDRGAAAVHVSAGEPAERVRAGADGLREALGRVTGGPVQVTVHPRQETLDVRV
jgi:hypothetical protein